MVGGLFQQLLNDENGNDARVVDIPSTGEVKKAINKLKNCKTAGKDKTPVKLLKYGNTQIYWSIPEYVPLKGWEDGEMPTCWLDILSILESTNL